MRRIVIFGRSGAGKSTLARRLGANLGLPVVELDQLYWRRDGTAMPAEVWRAVQDELTAGGGWILDGDLGPGDVIEPRLRAADTIVVLDLPAHQCARRVRGRSREEARFWWWMLRWRRRSLPGLMRAIAHHAPGAQLHRLRTAPEVEKFATTAPRSSRE